MPMVMQELEDLHIGRQVILTYSTKGRQLGEEQGPNGLGPILMNLPTDIFSPAMVDAPIMVAQVVQEVVTFGRIGVNGASWGNGPGHNRLQTLAGNIRHHFQYYLALFPPYHDDHRRAILGGAPSSAPALLGPAPRGGRAALWHHRQELDPYGQR